MPICEADPWRMQYFEGADCPPGVNVPTEDADAWEWNPEFRWIYDKIVIARNQGLDAGPHGTLPPSFSVFSKPIVNLKGMRVDTRIIHSAADYALHQTSGHMWMIMLEGRHVSTDVAIVGGEPRWWRHVTGQSAGEGTFDHGTVHADREPEIERYCGEWIARHLRGYTGMLNIETIGGRMIEMHLRFSDQWPDLHGPGWVQALVGLYAAGRWDFADDDRREGYSVVLFGPKGRSTISPRKQTFGDTSSLFAKYLHSRHSACQIKAVIALLHAAALTALVRGSHTCSVSMERKPGPERY
jgi:hypothetical protein